MDIERTRLENEVFRLLQCSNDNTPHFNYKVNFEKGTITLEVFTYNKKQETPHYLHSITASTPTQCLEGIIKYLENYQVVKERKNHYTMRWKLAGREDSHDSYYFEKNSEDLINKFFKGKNKEDYEWNIILNPSS